MNEQRRTSPPSAGTPASAWAVPTGFVTEANQRALEKLVQSNAAVVKGAFGVGQEMLAFAQRRLEANVEMWTSLAGCRSPGDTFEYERCFTEKATAQYVEEASKLASMMTRFASDCAGFATPGDETRPRAK